VIKANEPEIEIYFVVDDIAHGNNDAFLKTALGFVGLEKVDAAFPHFG